MPGYGRMTNFSLLFCQIYEEVKKLLAKRLLAPYLEGEEPYAEANGGAVEYCYFKGQGLDYHLSKGSLHSFCRLEIKKEK